MKRLWKFLILTSSLLMVVSLGFYLGGSSGVNIGEVKADNTTYKLQFGNAGNNFTQYNIPTGQPSSYTYYDTKQFNEMEWTLVVKPDYYSPTSIYTTTDDVTYLIVGESHQETYYFKLRSQMVGGDHPVVSGIAITVAGLYEESKFAVSASFDGEYYFVTQGGSSKVTVEGEEETTINLYPSEMVRELDLEGGYGEIEILFSGVNEQEGVKNGVKIKSVEFTLSTFNPDLFFAYYYEAYAFASRVQLANPCNEDGMAQLIADYDEILARGGSLAQDLPGIRFHDRTVIAGPRYQLVSVDEKMVYIRSRYGQGGNRAKAIGVEAPSSGLTAMASIGGIGFTLILIGALALRRKREK